MLAPAKAIVDDPSPDLKLLLTPHVEMEFKKLERNVIWDG
jgi:hypothetical protein